MTGYDEHGNQWGSPEANSHIKSQRKTTATREAEREHYKWCVERMRDRRKGRKARKPISILKSFIEKWCAKGA